jgi:hypothetical protein
MRTTQISDAAFPAIPNLLQKAAAVQCHFLDDIGRGVGLEMPYRPEDHLDQQRSQLDSDFGEAIHLAAGIIRIGRLGDYLQSFETLQPVGENIAGDPFSRAKKLLVTGASLEYQVAHDQQRPGVAQGFEGQVDWVVRAQAAHDEGSHASQGIQITCEKQVKLLG